MKEEKQFQTFPKLLLVLLGDRARKRRMVPSQFINLDHSSDKANYKLVGIVCQDKSGDYYSCFLIEKGESEKWI